MGVGEKIFCNIMLTSSTVGFEKLKNLKTVPLSNFLKASSSNLRLKSYESKMMMEGRIAFVYYSL